MTVIVVGGGGGFQRGGRGESWGISEVLGVI